MAFLFVWVVAINIGIQDITPRWFQHQFDWLSAAEIPPIFLSMSFASLLAAAMLWLFSGNGDKLCSIDASGISVPGWFGSKLLAWPDFQQLDREVSKIDCTGSQLEALIVYYRPDLYSTLARSAA